MSLSTSWAIRPDFYGVLDADGHRDGTGPKQGSRVPELRGIRLVVRRYLEAGLPLIATGLRLAVANRRGGRCRRRDSIVRQGLHVSAAVARVRSLLPPHRVVTVVAEMLGHLRLQRASSTSLVKPDNSPPGPTRSIPSVRASSTSSSASCRFCGDLLAGVVGSVTACPSATQQAGQHLRPTGSYTVFGHSHPTPHFIAESRISSARWESGRQGYARDRWNLRAGVRDRGAVPLPR